MQGKLQNINKKKLVMTMLSLLVIVLLYMSVEHKRNSEIDHVNIKISKIKGQKNLINKKDIRLIFRGYLGYELNMATMEELDLRMLEQILMDDNRVKKAEVYVDAKRRVNVYVKQRKPIVRINSGEVYNYYLDEDKSVIPVTKNNALRVPIATGRIEDIKSGLVSKKQTNLKNIYKVAMYVERDKFLQSLVEQIHVKSDNSIVIIPKLGREKIIIGNIKDMAINFKKLKEFYRNGLSKNGWDQFAELNLTYKDQIVALKR